MVTVAPDTRVRDPVEVVAMIRCRKALESVVAFDVDGDEAAYQQVRVHLKVTFTGLTQHLQVDPAV